MRAVIADEWSVLRGGVAVVLRASGVSIEAESSGAAAALKELHPGGPELLVLGLVADQTLQSAVERARAASPAVSIVVLVPLVDRQSVLELLDAGADAVLTRTAAEGELRDAVERVARGERFIAPGLLATLFGPDTSAAASYIEDHPLTDRERQVLALLVEGLSNNDIAKALYVGSATIKTHLHNVYRKLKVTNRVQAVARAIELRLLY